MRPELFRIGNSQSPIVVIDGFTGALRHIRELAAELAPYPPHTNYYPGLRRLITPADGAASDYVDALCNKAAQFIAGAFDVDGFTLLEASFSMVTTAPTALTPPQRAPHFDTTDPFHLAVIHYLRMPPGSGTAFYRQRSTGIERVTEANLQSFVRTAESQARELDADAGYVRGSTSHYEQIAAVDGVDDRLVIYQGSLLHSGIIPEDMNFSPDPRVGRLTANLFLRAHGGN